MLNRTNPFDDDDSDTVIDGSWGGCRGITPASFPVFLSTRMKADATPPFQNTPARKSNTKKKMPNTLNPFDDDNNDTVLDSSREGRREITPALFPNSLSSWTAADATPPFQNTPAQKSNTKKKMPSTLNPFDDDDNDTVLDGSQDARREITPALFPASLSSWTTAGATPPLHNSPGEADDDVTWQEDCNIFFTTLTSTCWDNVSESIHRCSDCIATSGAPGRKQFLKKKMLNRTNPFDDDDNDAVFDGSRAGRRGITPATFPASLSDATPHIHNSSGEVEDDVTWYHDCNLSFTSFTSKCWRNLIESIHRCSDCIATPGAPGRKENKSNIKMQNTTNPFDDDDYNTIFDGRWEGCHGITPATFPASLSDATPHLHNPFGEVDDDVPWYHDCNILSTTFTPKRWRNLIESIHRCSDFIATPGAPGRKENISKIKMQNTTNPFDDDDNNTIIDDSWE
jgi:hypothetical protein